MYKNILAAIIILCGFGMIGYGISVNSVSTMNYYKAKGYYEGQIDAIEGDIRVKKLDNGNYIWSSTPWDNGDMPRFNPSGFKGN